MMSARRRGGGELARNPSYIYDAYAAAPPCAVGGSRPPLPSALWWRRLPPAAAGVAWSEFFMDRWHYLNYFASSWSRPGERLRFVLPDLPPAFLVVERR